MRKLALLVVPAVMLLRPIGASAAPIIEGFEVAVNVDGEIYSTLTGGTQPAGFGADPFTGLGTILLQVTGAGSHAVSAFWDLDLYDELAGSGLFDDEGSAVGAAPAGLSWEVDEPGYAFGDIYDHFTAQTLDNTAYAGPEDISTALSWDFVLNAGETAYLAFVASTVIPSSGFYLLHTDPITQQQVAFYSSLDIEGGQAPIPEPGTLLLFGTGALAGIRRLRRRAA
jgi:hypothetical protein